MSDGLSVVDPWCVTCDSSCRKCTGTAATQCTSCYSGKYLLSSNSSCVSCDVDGYFVSGSQCLPCDPICLTCSGSSTNCVTCGASKYLLSSNSSCVDCNVSGYFISGSQCLECDSNCLTCSGISTYCMTCVASKYIVPSNNSCVDCNVAGHFISGTQCLPCYSTCKTCTGTGPTNCVTCVASNYFVSSNTSCVSCEADGYFISETECLQCDSTCKSCNDVTATSCISCYEGFYLLTINNSCTSCNDIPGYYANDIDQTCSTRTTVKILKFELQYPPQLYLLDFDTPLDLENSLEKINLYQITNSTITNMSKMSFTLTKLTSSSYELNFVSYTESNEVRYLLLSFDQVNSNHSYIISPSNSTAPISTGSTVASAADVAGTTSQAIFISAAASALFVYIQSKGASTQLMRILQIMARINFMKLININYLTPLAAFYEYADLGQFGLPNVFNKIPGFNISQASTNSTGSEGTAIFNDYFRYSFSQVFLDNYGGIVFSTCITLILYLLVKVACKCFKNKNSKIKKILIATGQSFEKSVIMTLIVSRYSYLCSALILNYIFIPFNGAYQQISFGFAILFTIIIAVVWFLAISVSFYHGRSKAKLKSIRPFLNLITLLCQEYHSKSYLGRIMTFWTLLSNLIIVLVLELLRKWVIVQLSVLIVLNAMAILIALPKNVFKTEATKITVIGTEVGFTIISILFLVIYSLENSNSYQVRLGLSWATVGVNVAIILFQIIVKIVEFVRLRRAKKREERNHTQASQKQANENSRIQFRKGHEFDISIGVDPNCSRSRSRSVNYTFKNLK